MVFPNVFKLRCNEQILSFSVALVVPTSVLEIFIGANVFMHQRLYAYSVSTYFVSYASIICVLVCGKIVLLAMIMCMQIEISV